MKKRNEQKKKTLKTKQNMNTKKESMKFQILPFWGHNVLGKSIRQNRREWILRLNSSELKFRTKTLLTFFLKNRKKLKTEQNSIFP